MISMLNRYLGIALFGLASCSSGGATSPSDAAPSAAWDCRDVAVPLGQTVECASTAPAPDTALGAPQRVPTSAPAYECSGDDDGPATSAPCPPLGLRFFCTSEDDGRRVCRRAPVCGPGSHRVQMDCESDISVGTGGGETPTSTGTGFPGGGASEEGDGEPTGTTECYYPTGTPPGTGAPAATVYFVLDATAGATLLHVRLTFTPSFVDNTYGAAAIGWPKGHKFDELVGSDHAELRLFDRGANEKLHFKLDYISKSATAPSGYASLGVSGGEGRMILGDASAVVKTSSSLDRNLNDRGYRSFVVTSPPTDASYTPSAAAPNWDYRVIYEAWLANGAFGPLGFGSITLAFVHASPSKTGANTVTVTRGPCPEGW